MKKEILKKWEDSTEELAKHFARYYFGKYVEEWWIAEEIGGVYVINDYFFGIRDMVEFLKYSYPRDKMFKYMDYRLMCAERGNDPVINIRSYKYIKPKNVSRKEK